MRFVLTFLIISLLVACEKKQGYRVDEAKEIHISEMAEDIKLPSKAWDLLQFKPVEEGLAEAPGHGEHNSSAQAHEEKKEEKHEEGEGGHEGGGEEKAAPAKNYTFSEVTVILAQKNEGVIDGEAVKIHLPKGGGTIDLSRYVTSSVGSFYVGFEFPAFEAATEKRVLFLSRTKRRKIGAEIFGAGCNTILDISERFQKEMLGEGLKVNTSQERYLSVMGGSFLFSAQSGNDFLLAQVTFIHPLFQPLFCEKK